MATDIEIGLSERMRTYVATRDENDLRRQEFDERLILTSFGKDKFTSKVTHLATISGPPAVRGGTVDGKFAGQFDWKALNPLLKHASSLLVVIEIVTFEIA